MEDFEWNVINEGQLLDAMIGHKPVGINKYFQMACIYDKFADSNKEITTDKIWKHLETMYNLDTLDENESLPFPNEEKDFILPDFDFGNLLNKREEEKKNIQKGRETPKSGKEIKKDEKSINRNNKDVQRRDSKDSKDNKTPVTSKKEIKKEGEKSKTGKTKSTIGTPKDDVKIVRGKSEETPKPIKRPTRGSLKPEDTNSNGKSSPINNTPSSSKRRRIV